MEWTYSNNNHYFGFPFIIDWSTGYIDLATGKLTAGFTSKAPGITLTEKAPGMTFSEKAPAIALTEKAPGATFTSKAPSIGFS